MGKRGRDKKGEWEVSGKGGKGNCPFSSPRSLVRMEEGKKENQGGI